MSLSGIPEIIENGKDGIFVTPGNSAELADTIELLLDRDFAEKLGPRAVKRYTKLRNTSSFSFCYAVKTKPHDYYCSVSKNTGVIRS